jgi:hypothetical protein
MLSIQFSYITLNICKRLLFYRILKQYIENIMITVKF